MMRVAFDACTKWMQRCWSFQLEGQREHRVEQWNKMWHCWKQRKGMQWTSGDGGKSSKVWPQEWEKMDNYKQRKEENAEVFCHLFDGKFTLKWNESSNCEMAHYLQPLDLKYEVWSAQLTGEKC